MITRRITNNASLRVIAKRAAAVRRQDKLVLGDSSIRQHLCFDDERQQQQQKQYHSTLTRSNFMVGNLRDDNDGEDDQKKRYSTYYPTQNTTQMQPQLQPQLQLQLQSTQLEPRRMYHTTPSSQRGPAIIMGLATVSALGFAGSSAIKSYNEWKDAQPTKEEMEEMRKQEESDQATMNAKEEEDQQQQQKNSAKEEASDKPRTNIFREWFDVGTKYYEGGFEDTMTRREAALILGVRESSSPVRVKDAHRKLLILNHPDTGGSNYLAGKLNEAKELLLKGKSQRGKNKAP